MADRLFHSIGDTWRTCLTNMSDVKELIPEFFTNPEFLRNANALPLGTMQKGHKLGDVELPPWASAWPSSCDRVMPTPPASPAGRWPM